MIASEIVLVTGAAGFVGGRIVEALFLSGAATPRAGIRTWSSAARIARFPVDLVLCDIMKPEQIEPAMDGVSTVVHCAYSDARDVIVQGTRNVLEAAQRAGVDRVVFISTAEVYGHDVAGIVDETFPCRYTGWEYADSKIDAERLCWEFCAKGLPVTVLRPSIVYGPFCQTWIAGFARRLRSGQWGIFQQYGDGICNLVYVDDLVSATFLAAHHNAATGEAFNVNGPDIITWNEFFRRFNTALGLPALREISPARLRLKASVMDLARLSAGRVRQVVGPAAAKTARLFLDADRRQGVKKTLKRAQRHMKATASMRDIERLYSRRAIYTASKAQDKLGYQPRFDADRGLQLSVRWLEHHSLARGSAAEIEEAGQP